MSHYHHGEKSHEDEGLERGLSSRHINMIAIGGAIGVGLFLGSATTIHAAGPAILVTYAITGIMIFFIMRALGEMAVEHPVAGSFSAYANDYCGPLAGYMTGWTYWITWTVTCMAELTACGVYINFWFEDFPRWLTALIALVLLTTINLTAAKLFGEVEFWFALIKVVTIIALILVGFGMIFFGFANGGVPIGISRLTAHGGFMPKGISGVMGALTMVAFAFVGVELIGVTAGEAQNPRKVIPKAINAVFWRILIFYIGALFVIMCIYPWDELPTDQSPFVMVFAKIGITAAAGIVNFVVLTAASSSCNSGIFTTGRMLFNLAQQGHAPKFLNHLSGRRIPDRAILTSAAIMLFGVVLNYILPEKAFIVITSVSTVGILFIWAMIVVTQMMFRKTLKHPAEVGRIHFKMPLYPVSNIICLVLLAIVFVATVMSPDTRSAVLVGAIWFVALLASYYIAGYHKEPWVKLLDDGVSEE